MYLTYVAIMWLCIYDIFRFSLFLPHLYFYLFCTLVVMIQNLIV